MAYEQKDNQGSIFANNKQNDRQPDYKGTININGVTMDLAGWSRTSNSGKEYISLKVSEHQDRGDAAQAPASPHQPLYEQAEQVLKQRQRAQQAQPMPENAYEPQSDDLPF